MLAYIAKGRPPARENICYVLEVKPKQVRFDQWLYRMGVKFRGVFNFAFFAAAHENYAHERDKCHNLLINSAKSIPKFEIYTLEYNRLYGNLLFTASFYN